MTKAEALEASILHWQENVKAETPEDAYTGPDECALCCLYYENVCCECPVAEKTHEKICKGSPYVAADDAYNKWSRTDPSSCANTWLVARDEFRQCAQAEVDFLISLRRTK